MSNPPVSFEKSAEDWLNRQKIPAGEGVEISFNAADGLYFVELEAPPEISSEVLPGDHDFGDSEKLKEFTHLRYTAATCDPEEFKATEEYTLCVIERKRQVKLLIALTAYNEDLKLYARSLHSIMENIHYFCSKDATKSGHVVPRWEEICVVLVVDGLDAMEKSVFDLLTIMRVYQDGIIRQKVDDKPVVAHIFEYTTRLSKPVDEALKAFLPDEAKPNDKSDKPVPVQFIFVLKAKNQKKINSHRWVFNAIGKILKPEVCILVDMGTKPGKKSIYRLWKVFDRDQDVGGACGEIYAMTESGKKLLNPLVAAQNFEYKVSNTLDKPFESAFGYVSVLPGAFSAYRFRAIEGAPLKEYFRGDRSMAIWEEEQEEGERRKEEAGTEKKEMSIFWKNMFLAEDRILCFEIVAKKGEKWTLAYDKSCKAETDVPERIYELIGQRRRWLNGSFAASIYALGNFSRFYETKHGIVRKFFFHVQALYTLVSLIFSWFALASLWLAFSIITSQLPTLPNHPIFIFGTATVTHWFNLVFKWIYLALLALQFVLALGNRPKGELLTYRISLWVFAFISLYLIVCAVWLIVIAFENTDTLLSQFQPSINSLILGMIPTLFLYLLASILFRDAWHMVSSFPQYLLLASTYTNVLNVYAFCNLHDVSWGTKGSDISESEKLAKPVVREELQAPAVAPAENPQPFRPAPSSQSVGPAKYKGAFKSSSEVKADFDSAKERIPRKPSTTESNSWHQRLGNFFKGTWYERSKERHVKPTMDDENKTFRTRLVAIWMVTNAGLAVIVESLNGLPSGSEATDNQTLQRKQRIFLAVILYATLALALVRFFGCVVYLLVINTAKFARWRKNRMARPGVDVA